MELVREILLQVANDTEGRWRSQAFGPYSESIVAYHVSMMIEAGLLSGVDASSMQGRAYLNCELTWAGNDFLDSASDSKLWKEAKASVDKLGGASIQVWTAILTKYAMSALGL